MKIYTKSGDKGMTSYIGGRIKKDHIRMEVEGVIDELSSHIGLIIAVIKPAMLKNPKWANLFLDVQTIQNDLYWIAAEIAGYRNVQFQIEQRTRMIETEIDVMTKELEPIGYFILPGGSEEAARFHVARTLARKAERRLVTLKETLDFNANILSYINRLSDYLFTAARYSNMLCGIPDVPATKG